VLVKQDSIREKTVIVNWEVNILEYEPWLILRYLAIAALVTVS
jgi:hypothetical protein